MWTSEYQKFYPNITIKEIWNIWEDVNNWASWHDDLDYCKMDGEFKEGNHFILKPKDGPKVRITLTKIKKMSYFTDCTKFFGAKMFDTHSIVEKDGGVMISNKITVTGPLEWLWVKLVAKDVAASTPAQTDALVKKAKNK